jgi:hypothetical protein
VFIAIQRTDHGRYDRSDSTKLNGVSLAGAPQHQQRKILMSKLSRRSLVSFAAALPALTVPAVASALPAQADIELQQLGVGLLKVNRDINAIAAGPENEDYDDTMNAALYRLRDLMAFDIPPDRNHTNRPCSADGCRCRSLS